MNDNQAPRIKPVPDQYTAVTPWIISPSSAGLIGFLTAAFDAQEVPNSRITNEDGIIIHAVVKIGDAMILLFDSREGWPPSPSYLNLYVEDIASTAQKAQELGAVLVTSSTELWFGEKVCRLLDPFGNLWWLNQRVEAVDFTDPRIGQRASTDEAIAGIAYIQKSLNEAMLRQKDFFANSGE